MTWGLLTHVGIHRKRQRRHTGVNSSLGLCRADVMHSDGPSTASAPLPPPGVALKLRTPSYRTPPVSQVTAHGSRMSRCTAAPLMSMSLLFTVPNSAYPPPACGPGQTYALTQGGGP